MGRMTNEQLGTKLDALIEVLTEQAMPAAQSGDDAEVISTEGIESVKVDDAYLTHQKAKAKAHAESKGENVVLYARKNKLGETKVAYALQERYDTQIAKQPSHLGAIETFSA